MEMQHIRYFLALCEERNFTRAARRCGVAQPSLTRAIKRLEKELGGDLFERSRKTTEMTAFGRSMRPHFLEIDRAVANARREAGRQAGIRPTNGFHANEHAKRVTAAVA
jgi:DNA-binding transcriptional LysR family regulator